MGRLIHKRETDAPKRRKLAGLERRWLVNNVSVMVVLAALCVTAVTLCLGAYYYSNIRSGLEAKASFCASVKKAEMDSRQQSSISCCNLGQRISSTKWG